MHSAKHTLNYSTFMCAPMHKFSPKKFKFFSTHNIYIKAYLLWNSVWKSMVETHLLTLGEEVREEGRATRLCGDDDGKSKRVERNEWLLQNVHPDWKVYFKICNIMYVQRHTENCNMQMRYIVTRISYIIFVRKG